MTRRKSLQAKHIDEVGDALARVEWAAKHRRRRRDVRPDEGPLGEARVDDASRACRRVRMRVSWRLGNHG
jgi:hypothetical protein